MKCVHLPGSQQGQALAEFIVVLLALAALLVLFPLIGKYQDISHQTQMASRYVAWQSTVRNDADGGNFASADEMARDVRKRFFGPTTSRISTGDAASDTPQDRNPLWVDHKGNPLLRDFQDVRVSFGPTGSNDPTAGFSGGGSLNVVYPTLSPGTFGLSNRGIFRGAVEVRLANLDVAWLAPFDNLNLSIARHTSVMPDSWAVAGAARVESRVTDSQTNFPSTPLKAPALLVTLPVMVLEDNRIKAPELGKVDFWRDTVPADRLK